MEKKVLIFILVALVVGLVVGAIGGYAFGKQSGSKDLKKVVDLVYPEPAKEMHQISGVVKSVEGAQITIEAPDPSDYIPHTDGTPMKKVMKYAMLTGATKIVQIDSTSMDGKGNPKTSTLTGNDIKEGMSITVKSEDNIRATDKFDVTEIQIVKY